MSVIAKSVVIAIPFNNRSYSRIILAPVCFIFSFDIKELRFCANSCLCAVSALSAAEVFELLIEVFLLFLAIDNDLDLVISASS